jgi:hypothetical protein
VLANIVRVNGSLKDLNLPGGISGAQTVAVAKNLRPSNGHGGIDDDEMNIGGGR